MTSRRQFLAAQASACALLLSQIQPASALDLFWLKTPTWASITQQLQKNYPDLPSLETSELAAAIAAGESILLIDVRGADEFTVSHLAGAVNVQSLEAAQKLPRWRSAKKIVFYCSVGIRSAKLAKQSRELGVNNSFNLTGSLFQWANENRELRQGDNIVKMVHPYNSRWGTLLRPEVRFDLKGK